MANNNPVSGLMTSMNRIRNQRSAHVAQGDTASQAGTLPAVQPPTVPTVKPTSFTQVLPVPQQPQPTPTPTLTAPSAPVSAPIPSVPNSQASVEDKVVIRTTKDMLDGMDDIDLADAFVLSLGYLFGVPKSQNPAQ